MGPLHSRTGTDTGLGHCLAAQCWSSLFRLRIMYTDAPGKSSHKDWYSLHGCQSDSPALDYLKKVHTWLQAHPKEILVVWATRHGDSGKTGTDQYPNTTPEERQAFFNSVKSVFGDMMHNSTFGRINETSVPTLW